MFLSEELVVLSGQQETLHDDIDPLESYLSFTFPANVAEFDKSSPKSNGNRRSHSITFLTCERLLMGLHLPFKTV